MRLEQKGKTINWVGLYYKKSFFPYKKSFLDLE